MSNREETLTKTKKTHFLHHQKHDTMKFFPMFLGNSSKTDYKLKPSIYLREMMLSTDQRLEQLNKLTKKTRSSILLQLSNQKDFKISPPVVVFQSFQPGKQYSATVTVCNISEASKIIGVKSKPTHTFCVSYLSKVTSKLAPGMSLHFLIKFMPLADQDYSDNLTLETDGYTIDIPLDALGSRPLVNFPDFIDLKETLVKIPSNKSFYVKNIGQVPATFNMMCERPFSVSPARCVLDVGKIVMITIHFETDILDDFFKNMIVRFETGEELWIDVSGSTRNGNVWLDLKHVYFEDTFMGLKRQEKVTLYNDTEVTIKFSWHRFRSREQDLAELERMRERFDNVKLDETIRCTKLEYNDIISENNHANVYSRIFEDEVELLSPKDLYFSNANFDFNSVEGELWPGGRYVMAVTFSPHSLGTFSCTAYCDVTGVAHRLPLQMTGEGLGPVVQLNIRSLDIGPIFLGLTQGYEIVAANKGDIPCRIEHVPAQTVFGGTLTVEPQFQCIMPYEMKSFIITFNSGRTGSFVEDVFLKITQSNEILKVLLKGIVVNPTISFNNAKLDFGVVAVGFPKTKSVGLVNQSQVPVEFALRVPSDGVNTPITCDHFVDVIPKPSLVTYCNEFTISPNSGIIDPNSTLNIEVTLITNSDRINSCVLVAENKNSKLLESVSLSLMYESRVATLVCNPSELILRFSFINFEYTLDFTLTNTSTLPAYFYFPPQNHIPLNNIQYTTDVSEALLEPGEAIKVTVGVVPVTVGRVRQDIMVLLFGNPILTSLCSISCSVQGPNVSANVGSLEYGKMTLMEPKTLTFELSNDSPISACFIISIEERAQCKWEVDPMIGELAPEESVMVSVTLQVLDPGTINNALSIQVVNSRVISIGLLASASGCGITIEPNIFPEIDLGYLFSRRLYQFVLTLYNPGSRHHFIMFVQDRASLADSSNSHVNLFKFSPNKFDLIGGGKAQVVLEGQSSREVEVIEAYSCLAIINKRGVKQLLGNFLIKANFISPMVEVSEELLEFQINVRPQDQQGKTDTKSLRIKSVASLPVTMVLELNPPFIILENNECFSECLIELQPNQETEIVVGFNPPPQSNLVSTVYEENLLISYKEHPQKDTVPLKGKLNFPNIELSQHTLDFECIPLDFEDYKQIVMTNPTPLPATFSFSWDPNSIIVVLFDQENIEDILEHDLIEELAQDPLRHNRLLSTMENKESVTGPLPLVYVEPVTVSAAALAIEKQEDYHLTEEEMKDIHELLFPLIEPHFSVVRPTPEFNILADVSPRPFPDVSQIFDLTPVFGTIGPYQRQVLNVAFRPQQFMGVAVTAMCSVNGGPTETIHLTGQSARHLFSVSTTFINFGFRVFMEPCEETIKITNMSQLPFSFKVASVLSPPMVPEVQDIQMGSLTVEPCFGYVPAQESATLTVKFYPGLAGEFQQQFTIQVGYLEPVNVLVTGYGVLPQVAVICQHVSRFKIPISWGYKAVTSLTAKRFRHLAVSCIAYDFQPTNDVDLEDWVVVGSLHEKVPSVQDIWLALERVIAYNYVKENVLYLSQTGDNYKKLFCQCLTPGYILDLGSVVLGTTTHITVLVENRGLVRCDVKLILPMLEKKLKQLGFFVTFQNHIGLPVGKSVPLDIIIKPNSQMYSSKEEAVHVTFYLQVANGATVPIYLKALFTIPHIVVESSLIDFGCVEVGQCKKMCLLLKNSGAVKAELNVNLIPIKRKRNGKVAPEELVRFFVNKTSNLFLPKTAELLEIGFLPKEERLYETTMRLEVKHNPEIMTVRLCGNGVEPRITFSPKTVQFGAHVPYSGPIEKKFSITNPSPFNVQVYFPDFDRSIMNEDRVLRILTNCYKCENITLPLEMYDKVPSSELENFYDQIKNEATNALKFMEFKNKCSAYSEESSDLQNSKLAHCKMSQKSTVLKHSSKYSSGRKISYNPLDSIPDPFASLEPEEVETRLVELINDPDNILQLPRDPLGLEFKCLPHLTNEVRNPNKGILMVFHGAPLSDYKYWANRTGKTLNHKIFTLDELILQEAATSDRLSAVHVQEAINNAYMELALNQESMERLSSSGPGVSFEELCERMNFLSTAKEPTVVEEVKRKVDDKKPTSKPGTAKKEEKIAIPVTFNDIPVEIFVDLLRDRLLEEVERGMVLESLTGFFLKTINSAVNVILKCVGHIGFLLFITVYSTLEEQETKIRDRLIMKERLQKAAEAYKILEFDHMTSDEIEQLSPHEKLLFESSVVEERRQWYNALRAKRQETRALKIPADSPQTTERSKSKSGDKKLGKKLLVDSALTKSTKKTDKKIKVQIKETALSRGKKSSLNSPNEKKSLRDEQDLKEAFDNYEMDVRELTFLLSHWNKNKAEFEGLDRPPSLFNVMKQSKPQSRKAKDASRTNTDSIDLRDEASVGVGCVIVCQTRSWKPDGLMKFITSWPTYVDSLKSEKEYCDITLPDPLVLSSVSKPELRIQNDRIIPFDIFDYKRKTQTESVLENGRKVDLKSGSEEETELLRNPQEYEDSLEGYSIGSKTIDSHSQIIESRQTTVLSRPFKQSKVLNEDKDDGNPTHEEQGVSINLNEKFLKQSLKTLEETSESSDEKEFTSRVELAPGGKRSWSVSFDPETAGTYNHVIQLEVARWRKTYHVVLEAICDIPRIDNQPASMFEKVNETLSSTTISQCVFLNDTKTFYFGPVFATAANQYRTNDLTTNFYFTNISALDVEMEFSLLNEQSSHENTAFGFKPNHLHIPPNETKALEVFACPTVVGKHTETLVYSIFNNAKPGFIEMSCIGVKPAFEFEPKEIRFERVLLYRKEFSELTLSNKCYKPLGWRLVDLLLLSKQVSVSQQSGVIPAMENTSVYINFSADYVEVANHTIYIEVFDDQFRGRPFVSEPIPVILESVDVLVDITFPKDSESSELKFKSVKVGEPEAQILVLKNIGKYDVTFAIKFNEDLKLNFNPYQVFTFTPKSGLLPKLEKPVPVKVTCNCTKPEHVNKLPVFKIWLVDTGPEAQPIAAIPINVSIEAFSSQYRVIPESELNFSSMLVGTKKVEHIVVENTGKFEFMFQVLPLKQIKMEELGVQQAEKATSASKANRKITLGSGLSSPNMEKGKPNPKGKEKKDDIWSSLTVGAFTLSHSGAIVSPGESFKIDVECYVPTQDTYYEEIVIKIMEYAWIKRKGTCIKLKAISYLPFINFENVHNIFQEACPFQAARQDEGEPLIKYDSDTNILYFSDACVGAQSVMYLHLHLYNSGLVPCEATATVTTTNSPRAFYVTPEKFTVMSHSELTVSLTFRPMQIGVFTEVLEVKVELPSPLKSQIFTTQLIGDAHLPQILVTAPPSPHILMFPPTLVGEYSEEMIAFVNTSNINCSVIMEVLANKNGVFIFYSGNNSSSLIKGNLHQVHLKKGEGYKIVARFSPNTAGKVTCQVKLLLTNNPYEDLTIKAEGIGYLRDIIIDGLPLAKGQDMNVGSSSEIHGPSVKYELSLPSCSVGDFVQKVVLLKNQTQEAWYRFQWDEVEFIAISPSSGHLPPDSSKELLVVFQSHHPKTIIEKKEVMCNLCQIHLINYNSPVGWDNHQKTVKWLDFTEGSNSEGCKRVVCSREEPEYEEQPGSGQSLSMIVSACADFPQLSCPTEDILFPSTIISQIDEHNLLIQNTGIVSAQFLWVIRDQVQGQAEYSMKTCYGSVTMSSERPKLQPGLVRRKKVSKRPATCPDVRPGLLSASVTCLSQDDFLVQRSSSKLELTSSWPIFVEPLQGRIPPGENITCSVIFKPMEMGNYSCNLHLRLEGGETNVPSTVMKVEGSSTLPCCHLVVPDCSPCSNSELLQINFRVMGTKKPVNKCVKVVNTTYEDYTLYLREINQDQLSAFGCSKPISHVSATKHVEVMFNFTPRETGHYKSTWQLSIPDRQIQQNILLVGEAFQPSVSLSSTFLQLRPTLIGVQSEGKVVLMNNEDCELKFSVDTNSLHCGNWSQTVQVQPLRGVIPAQAQIDLRVTLNPTQAGQGQFMVQIVVQKLEKPLKLDVAAQCFQVQPVLVYQDFNNILHHMQSNKENYIDIGVVEVRIPVTLTFNLTNIGKPTFHYSCMLSSDKSLKDQLSITVSSKTGLVGPQSRQLINVVITPLTRTVFSRVRLELVISKGPTFIIFFNGTAAKPHYKFSLDKYNFGACFVQKSDVDSYKTDLVFTNSDENPLLIEGEFDQKPHLKVGLTQTVVKPRSELLIPITFLPLDCCTYEETLCFLVDGSYRHEVAVIGRGIDLNVMLVNPADKLVDLEGVVVGRSKRRTLEVVNNSEAKVTAMFTLEPLVAEICLSPDQPVTLWPHQATVMHITFTPNTVVKGIQQELILSCQSIRRVLSVLKASSVGISVKTDRDYLPFGTTVIGNSPTSKLLLSNVGDLVVKFLWETSNPVFTIEPCEGYIAPGTDVVLMVKYSPLKLQPMVHAKGVCTLSNGEELLVTLSGSCVDLPPPSMTISLSCPVRHTDTTHIPVFNKFGQEIKLTASISGEYFSGDSVTLIPPYATHMFKISYSPLSMTTPSQLHKGTAVFYFVDGTCLVYSLEGSATEPTMTDKLVSQLSTHTPHTLLVPVHNWMQTPQKFRVTHELLSSNLNHPGYQLTYNEYFMVSGSQTRDLTLSFMCHFPGLLTFKVVLTNEISGDYKWYEVIFEVSPCPPLGEIMLQSHVRQEAFHNLLFYNPLDDVVSVDCKVNLPGLSAVSTPVSVRPLRQEVVKLKYLPVWPSEPSSSTLELTCSDLGVFPYTVTTCALPALPSSPVHIRCDLGQSISKEITLTNPTNLEATFQCSSSLEDVKVKPQQVNIGPNQSKTVQILYQPSYLSDITGEIVATSPEAGEFIFPVVGICNCPEPRGPFTFTPGSFNVVSFKNVFKEEKTFILSIDNPVFSVKKTKIVVESNQVVDVKIEMLKIEAKEFPKYPITGKMTVFAEDESLSHIKWLFYLRGELV